MKKIKTYNPFNNSLVGEFEYHSKKRIDKTLETLRKGYKKQKELSANKRALILAKLSHLLDIHSSELSKLITIETGKTINDSRAEMKRAVNTAFCASVEARNIKGEVLDANSYAPETDKVGMVKREGLGTILCITPFNFPINLALHKIAPAFAAGNSILLKPHPQNYQSAKLLVDLCHKAGMPQDTIQFCFPDIPTLTEIIKEDNIQAISFTGGEDAANAIAKNSGRKKLLLELGGNDPVIIMPDADIDLAVMDTINSRFGNAGQKCTASKRIFVHKDVYDKFKNKLIEESSKLGVGDPMNSDTFCGPLANKEAADKVERKIKAAIAKGAKLLLGGTRQGNIISPTILENLADNCDIINDEIFGPVVPLIKFIDVDEMIEKVNSTNFGLQAGVFTNDLTLIKKLYNEIEVGALIVNSGPGYRSEHFPFGGVKGSGIGREGIRYAIQEMSVLKTLIF